VDVGLDTGPMLLKGTVPIGRWTTATSLTEELADLGARLVVEAVAKLEKGELPDIPQPEDGMTYAAKLDRADGAIDWNRSATEIDRQVRALNPWPGTSFEVGGDRIKLLEVTPTAEQGKPGTIIGTSEDGSPVAACGEGALKLTLLQRPGRAAQDGASFLRGFALPPGTVLGGHGDALETDHRV
jgi:methionyl-tRNA formyltransferase